MNNTPTILSIITQALDAYINDLVDKRFHERMAEIQIEMPNMAELEDAMTELVEKKMSEIKNGLNEMIDDKITDHTSTYDHDEYDEVIGKMKDVDFEDMEEAVKNALRNIL